MICIPFHRGRDAHELYVRIGSSEKSNGGSVHKIKRIVQNEQYNVINTDYDFALLEVEDSIEFNENQQPITLINADYKVDDDTMCLVTGWGNTLSLESDEKLRGVEVPIVNQQKCMEDYDGIITPRMVCAGWEKGGKDSCQSNNLLNFSHLHLK